MSTKTKDVKNKGPLRLLFGFFTSFKLATIVLVLMTLITLLGTLDQVGLGLHGAKEKYFHSWFIYSFRGFPLFLPGGLLLMSVLFINMICGAIIKVRKRWRGAGLLISHTGMLMLLAGGWITWAIATDGYMALYPGMTSSRVESYRDWQLEVYPLEEDGSPKTAWILPTETLQQIQPDQQFVTDAEGLPFDIVINGYAENATPIPVSAPIAATATGKEIDGFKLSPKKRAKEEAMNLPGCYIEFRPKGDSGGEPVEAILWAGSYKFDPRNDPMPLRFEIGGEPYAAMLAKKSWNVPFEVTLDEFIFEKHPGISTARNYESRVTRIEEGRDDKPLEIKMNEPMRYAGYTFFQESFGPAGSEPGDEMYSQFAVANNPADQWPLWALCVTGVGLLIHFVIMLIDFILRSRKKRAASTS